MDSSALLGTAIMGLMIFTFGYFIYLFKDSFRHYSSKLVIERDAYFDARTTFERVGNFFIGSMEPSPVACDYCGGGLTASARRDGRCERCGGPVSARNMISIGVTA